MNQALIAARIQRELSNDGRHTQMILPGDQSNDDDDKPFECCFTGKARAEFFQDLLESVKHLFAFYWPCHDACVTGEHGETGNRD